MTPKLLLITLIFLTFACDSTTDPVDNPSTMNDDSTPTEVGSEFVDSLLAEMTLREKVGQLNQYSVGEEMTGPGGKDERGALRYERLLNGDVGSVLNLLGAENTRKLQQQVVEESRLGIPLLFAYDVIHGYKTMFPLPLAESASWDLAAMEQAAAIAAKEAAAAGLHWTFAPMVDISREPRWGRVMEGAGEDPYLGSLIAAARVRGFQGSDLSDPATIAACAKHFAAYGFAESGKDYNTVTIGNNTLFNYVLPPFEATLEEDVATFMNSFNDIDGIPATAHRYLLRDILKGEWGFDGVVVSDWNSIGELVNHGVAADNKEAAALAIKAGSDIDMEADAYSEHLLQLVESGQVEEALIDDAVRRVLLLKERMGLFADPYRYSDVDREQATLGIAEHMEAARDIARKSIVLLKNDGNLLPLKENTKQIAIIGPLAKDKDTPIGNWRGQAEAGSAVSFYEGMEAALGEGVQINYAEGAKLSIGENTFFNEVTIDTEDRSGFGAAREAARGAEVVFMVLGEPAYMSGEARSRANIDLPGLQLELLQEVYEVNKNIVLVLMNGRPLTLPWEAENIPTILETWHLGSQAGHAIADVITGGYNPAGKLTMSFPRSVGQIPVYYNYKNTGRPTSAPGMIFYHHYMDEENTPLFPFGHGLSYTTFEYGDIQLAQPSLNENGSLEVSISLTNTGQREGEEVVQLYIRDLVASISRPVMELKKFEKVKLAAGETKEVSFSLNANELGFYNQDLEWVTEPGDFELFIGGSSMDVQKAAFRLE